MEKLKFKKIKQKNPLKSKTVGEFKKFISKGNLIDLAVAVIIGAAFTAIVTSLVNDIFMPLISAAVGKSLSDLIWVVNGKPPYLDSGTENPEAIIIRYGNFIQTVINFLITAIVMFVVVKVYLSFKTGYKNKFYGFSAQEYNAFLKEGKKRKDIKLLAIQRDKDLAEKAEREKKEKEKDSVENILKDIRLILQNQSKENKNKESNSKKQV